MPSGPSGRLAGASLLVLVLAGDAPTQPAATAPDRSQPFQTTTTAVVVDVVVRDRKGVPVVDLKQSDFELLEDGVPQKIGTMSLIAPGAPVAGASPAGDATPAGTRAPAPESAAGSARPAAGPTLMAFVFHRLSPEARALAQRAGEAYLATPERPSDLAGVFLIDQSLETIQTYTTDRSRLRAALEEAAARATSVFGRSVTSARGTAGGERDASVSPTAGAESAGRPIREPGFVPRPALNTGTPAPDTDRLLEIMKERMEEQYQEMSRSQQGYTTTNALVALADSMSVLPGRKTVVFFAEGLSISSDVQQRFQAVVEAANRGNVSFYTVDAAGLRVHSEQAATARAVASSGFAGTGDTPPDEAAAETGGGALTKRLEKNEFTLRQDPHASLGLLARATGGFLIENTNDLAGAFGRIDADRRFHYLLTYTSANAVQDGSYRRLTVKVRRKNVDVRARSGYYAVPALGTLPTLHFETAALAALAERPRRTEIPIRASALAFPTPARPGQLAIVVAVPGTGLTYYMDREKTSYWSDFTILTQIVDAEGRVVRKGSQPYHLTGPADRLDVARRGDVLLYRQPVLPPGRYTLDYVISDALGAKAGTGSMPLVVDAVGPGEPAVSGLVIVSRAERVTEAERDPINPLYVGDLLLYPNLGDPLSRSADRRLTFYYAVHAGTQPVTASLELATGEVVLARLPLSLPPPDAAGRIQHLAQFPLGDVPPGSCELRVTVTAGSARVTRVAAFTLEP